MPTTKPARAALPMDLGDIAVAPGVTCGALLAATRRQCEMELGDIARITRFSGQFIAAIEEGDYTEFAAPIYLRGAVRGYARAVGLEPDALIKLLDREIAARRISWRRSGWLA